MDVSFDQLLGVATTVGLTLSGAIGVLAKWIAGSIKDLQDQLKDCQQKHEEHNVQLQDVMKTAASLEARVLEMQRLDPATIAECVAKAVAAAIAQGKTL